VKEHALLIDLQQPNKSEVHSNAAAISSTTYSRIRTSCPTNPVIWIISSGMQREQESWCGVYQVLEPLIHSLRAQGHPPMIMMPNVLFRLCFIEPLANMLLLLQLTPSGPCCKPLLTMWRLHGAHKAQQPQSSIFPILSLPITGPSCFQVTYNLYLSTLHW